jgi:hypothetical protein
MCETVAANEWIDINKNFIPPVRRKQSSKQKMLILN